MSERVKDNNEVHEDALDFGDALTRYGDCPADLEGIPGSIELNRRINSTESELRREAKQYLENNPRLLRKVLDDKLEILACPTSRNNLLYIGLGVASLAGVIFGAIAIRTYKKKPNKVS